MISLTARRERNAFMLLLESSGPKNLQQMQVEAQSLLTEALDMFPIEMKLNKIKNLP